MAYQFEASGEVQSSPLLGAPPDSVLIVIEEKIVHPSRTILSSLKISY